MRYRMFFHIDGNRDAGASLDAFPRWSVGTIIHEICLRILPQLGISTGHSLTRAKRAAVVLYFNVAPSNETGGKKIELRERHGYG
jgi:hypothetical protein